jgi:hypothetical protein
VCASSLWLGACRGLPTGPSLSAVAVTGISLQSTTGNPALCCCRVVGTATNNNSVTVYLSIQFSAFDNTARTDPIAKILYFIQDLQSGTSRAINAPGFIFPCAAITRLQTALSVKGIAFPPF